MQCVGPLLVQWRKSLLKGILECVEPQVVVYLEAWERADARDEAYVRGGLGADVDLASPPKTVWERRAEAAGRRARRRTMGSSS